MKNQLSQDFRITQLGSRSALSCLGLAERTFGKGSPEYNVVLNFTKEKRAGYFAHIRRCVVGFIVYDNSGFDHTEVLALAVHKPDRRQGIGGLLLNRVVQLPRRSVTVKVDERELDVQIFLRSQGFRAVAIEHGGLRDFYVFERGKVGVASSALDVSTETQTAGAVK